MSKKKYWIISAALIAAAVLVWKLWPAGTVAEENETEATSAEASDPDVQAVDKADRYALARQDGMWHAEHLITVSELAAPEGVYMTLNRVTEENGAVATIHNESVEEWRYGYGHALHVKLEGIWYAVPVVPGKTWSYPAIALHLEPGKSVEETCGLGLWGELLPGNYRLVKEISRGTIPENNLVRKYLTAEFEIPYDSEDGDGENDLFDGASTGTSLLGLFYFDGVSGCRYSVDNFAKTEALLKKLGEVEVKAAENWEPSYPLYGMEIGTSDGQGLKMLWTNGYLITRTGEVYTFDYDFPAALEELKPFSSTYSQEIDSVSDVPNSYYLALREEVWDTTYLGVGKELPSPVEVSMTLKEVSDAGVTVMLKNSSKESWSYGAAFSLQVKLDDRWYSVPVKPDKNWAFVSIGYGLKPGGSVERTYHLDLYGKLPAGIYRLIVEDLGVEFEISG